jgi:hypothetical protein
MLERIQDLPDELIGIRATGKVTRDDYQEVVVPALEEARREGRRIRFLFHFAPGFEGFTPGAAWEDLRVGWRYLRLFERCAVVSDTDWIGTAARAAGAVMPCPVGVFPEAEREQALEWLRGPTESSLDYRLLQDRGVLVVEPRANLSAEDFDALEAAVDDWLETTGSRLQGLVVHAREFPGWENLGSTLRHVRFVRDHHRLIRRVAFASDSKLFAVAPSLADHFLEAEIERFDADALDEAIQWASGGATGRETSVASFEPPATG